MCCGGTFDIDTLRRRLAEVERRSADPELWQDNTAAMQVAQLRAQLTRDLEGFLRLDKILSDGRELLDLAEADAEFDAELVASLQEARRGIEALELQRLLGGPHDGLSALVSINAGAGGTESQDWAQMLLRMLLRWAERHGYGLEMLDTQGGDEAGIKSVSFAVEGAFAYGYLKGEAGVHRLVRISPFDSQKRRHTSFASVSVAPEVDDSITIDIRDDDLRVDTYRSSGAGGQHVNKTDSAVRLTHLPSGVVVACQAERSQHKNRAKAMKMLRAKLFELELRRQEAEKAKIAGEKKRIEWGSQIRSYVLQPYRMVKDHRTGCELSNTDAVLDGDLDRFIEAYLLGQTRSGEESEDEDPGDVLQSDGSL
jgi:peptide chain release factor 2